MIILRRKIIFFAQIVSFIIIMAALFHRAFLSVAGNDEIHGIASILNILEGKKPFVTSWDYHTGWCLMAPFYWIYITLQGGNREGIVLFSRIFYFLFSLSSLSVVAFLYGTQNKSLGRASTPPLTHTCLLSLAVHVPHTILQINYNSVTAYFLLILLVSLQTLQVTNADFYFAPGVITGLICITYPPMAAMALPLGLIVWLMNQQRNGVKKALQYGMGVSLVGVTFFLWILAGNRYELFLRGLKEMLASPHQFSRDPLRVILLNLLYKLKKYKPIVFLIFCYTAFQIWMLGKKHHSQRNSLLPFIVFLLTSVCNALMMLYSILITNNQVTYYYAYSMASFFVILIWIFNEPKLRFTRYGVYFAGILGFYVIHHFSSDSSSLFIGFHICAVIIAFLSVTVLFDYMEQLQAENLFPQLAACIPMLALLLFSAPGVIYVHQCTPENLTTQPLDTRVESGIFKGIYTSQANADFVVNFEREVTEHISSDKSLCVVTLEPAIYVMSRAKIYAPQTWDVQFLYRGFTSAEPLLSYFEAMGGELPDILAATDKSVKDFYENDKYEIVPFIRERYHLCYEKDVDGMTLWLWERNQH